jgi:peptide deformylase
VAGTPRKVTVVGDPVLHRVSRQVNAFDDSLATLIDDMFATMAVASGVGLAAPQIGVDLAVFVYDCPDADGKQHIGHMVNPSIVSTSGPIDEGEEGCLSVPGPYHELPRPSVATVRGVDKTGAPIEVTGTGFFARCLIHETEHLQGILYIDHLPRNRRRRILREMTPFSWNAS